MRNLKKYIAATIDHFNGLSLRLVDIHALTLHGERLGPASQTTTKNASGSTRISITSPLSRRPESICTETGEEKMKRS